MISGSLQEAAALMDARMHGLDAPFTGVSTDTRKLRGGELFFALQGPHFDGHAYVDAAFAAGAPGVVVERDVPGEPLIVAADTRLALGKLAAHWRDRCAPCVLAVTGSNGKTTVKEMLASVFADLGPTLATRGNLNNDVGVPLTLFELSPDHRYAVTELGANHAGEIEYLTGLAKPDVAVITNAGPSHLEGFGSVAGVARAKGEIFLGLPPSGTAVINADDCHVSLWRELAAPRKVITFGTAGSGDVDASLREGTLQITYGEETRSARTALAGQHNAANAAAASAAALALNVPLSAIVESLARVRPVSGRLQFKPGLGGATIIDDTYNANPASLSAALEVLGSQPQPRKVVVLGDMGELGDDGPQLHLAAGEAARETGVEQLYAVGSLAEHVAKGFGRGALCFDDPAQAAAALRERLTDETCVLVKGSRAMRMERAIAELVDKAAENGGRA